MFSTYTFLRRVLIALGCFGLFFSAGCRKLVEAPAPVTSLNSENAFTTDGAAIAVLTGIYSQISSGLLLGGNRGATTNTSLRLGLCADELTLYSGNSNSQLTGFYTNSYVATPGNAPQEWNDCYTIIFTCNAALAGMTGATTLTPAVKQQLLGEAKFMRAFSYFYLVNLFGGVPVPTTTDYNVNNALPRVSADSVYTLVISDLKDAANLLSANFLDGTLLNVTSERARPMQAAAEALLARVYLYTGDWQDAETEATAVISNGSLFTLESFKNVFLSTSEEAIWQLEPGTHGQNAQDGLGFILGPGGPNYYNSTYLSPFLLNSFEPGDQRRVNWVDSVIVGATTYYFPFKYKVNDANAPVTEYETMFRLGEQYLVRAEARTEQGNVAGAQADLNTIRSRAGLPNTTATDKPSLLKAVQHERQVELFTEWGQRWLDLKRTGAIDSVMSVVSPQKGSSWNTAYQLFPIPSLDIQRDPNLKQNPGY